MVDYAIMPETSRQSAAYTRGCLSKVWYRKGNKTFLVKGNSDGSLSIDGRVGCEPLAEVLASKLGQVLGFNVVDYILAPSKLFPEVRTYNYPYVSLCEPYSLREGEQVLTAYELAYAFYKEEAELLSTEDYIDLWKRLGIDLQQIYNMFLLDAIVNNTDRHLNNFDFIVNGRNIRLAPLIDFGNSCLSLGNMEYAKPFCNTHEEQLAYFKDYKAPSRRSVYRLWLSIIPETPDYIKEYVKRRIDLFL